MENAIRLYGVSNGNGNDGVSHLFADYYVRTSDPWRLAELAMVAQFKPGKDMAWAKDNAEIDGDEESTIFAMLLDPPCEDTEDGEYPTEYVCGNCGASGDCAHACDECGADDWNEKEYDDYEDGRNWSDANGAWMLVEVFPEDEPREGRPVYDTLEDCFSEPELTLVPASVV